MDKIEVGMAVQTADGETIGTVGEVGGGRFKVDVHWHPDYWLADEVVASVAGERVTLTVTKSHLIDVEEGVLRPTMSGNLNK